MDVKNLQDEIVALENELMELKTIQGVLPNMNAFTENYIHTNPSATNQIIEVEFADGDGLIFSGCTNQNYAAALDIVNNKQRFYFRLMFNGTKLTFYANRPILSVKNVS